MKRQLAPHGADVPAQCLGQVLMGVGGRGLGKVDDFRRLAALKNGPLIDRNLRKVASEGLEFAF